MSVLYDSHVHTRHSPDSQQPLDEICETALAKGLRGFAVTDHADLWFLEENRTFEEIPASIADAGAADAQYGDRLRVFRGVEMGEPLDDPENAAKILRMTDYDVVLGSIHSVRFAQWQDVYYSRIPFDEANMPEGLLSGFLDAYFRKLLDLAERGDFDVLTHLTCPLRYINGTYHRNQDWRPWREVIDGILRAVIRRDRALEVNASGIHSAYGQWMPDEEILKRYYALGGRRITLGSDAHTANRVGNAFAEAEELLKGIGFPGYCYFERRQPHECAW